VAQALGVGDGVCEHITSSLVFRVPRTPQQHPFAVRFAI
jgi:hypothetical protein